MLHLAAEVAASLTTLHPDYAILAGRIEVLMLHKRTMSRFSQVIHALYHHTDGATGKHSPTKALDAAILYKRDYDYTYFGFKTLERSYLPKLDGIVCERPQHLLMRVSVGIHHNDIEAAIRTYGLMSEGYFTHASPTMFNAGTRFPQLSSCYLLTMSEDSIEGI